MIEISRAVRHGTLVAKRGSKYIRCSSRATPVGVYDQGGSRITLTDKGEEVTAFPRGIVVYGEMRVQVKTEGNK